ncbi:MAG: hypothetical protein ACRELS_01205 [Candidatus Rokuibacteriota bacterium]
MKKLFAVLMSVAVIGAFTPVEAQTPSCPPEVAKAKDMLSKKGEIARGQDIQAPRTLAGARGQDVQAPRGQDVQAPRGQDVQAPRGQDVQAPRGQDVQAPRGQDVQAPRGQAQQAPRGQDIQAPRGQDVQAPRGQDVQAPRGQDIQAPRGQDVQAPRTAAGVKSGGSTKAAGLVREAEAACKAGDMGTAKAKAEAAITELK